MEKYNNEAAISFSQNESIGRGGMALSLGLAAGGTDLSGRRSALQFIDPQPQRSRARGAGRPSKTMACIWQHVSAQNNMSLAASSAKNDAA